MKPSKNIKELVKEFLNNHKDDFSQTKLAKSLGFSNGSLISQYLNESETKPFKGDRAELEKKLENFINNFNKSNSKSEKLELEFLRVENVKKAEFVINEAIEDKTIGVIYGSPGVGKTEILKEFVKITPQSIFIESNPITTTKDLFAELCKKLGEENTKGSLSALFERVINKLKNRDAILIIDEVEYLKERAIDMIRRINDKCKTPIVLCGTEEILRVLQVQTPSLRQIKRRIGVHIEIEALKKEEVELICEKFNISEYASSIVELGNKNFDYTVKLIKKSFRLAKLHNVEVSEKIIKEAYKMLLL